MENFPTWQPVVALALFDEKGRVLLQQRPLKKHHGGLWEFPGGKVEPREKPRDALIREIAEELSIMLDPGELTPVGLADDPGDHGTVLLLYNSRQEAGEIIAREGQEWGWFTLQEAALLALAPMDRHLLTQLPL